MTATITRISLVQALSLRSTDSFTCCLTCGNSIFLGVCECPDQDRIEMEDGSPVALLMDGKRRDFQYEELREQMRSEGQRTPLRICFYGWCLLDGHHRIAVAQELG